MPDDSIEMVDDFYWLKWAKDHVESAITGRDAAIERILSAVPWFWTVYTAVAILGVALSERDFVWWRSVLIFLPIPILLLSYLVATWARTPLDLAYDPGNPSAIKEAFTQATNEKRKRLGYAMKSLFVAALSVALAGYSTSTATSRIPLNAISAKLDTVKGERMVSVWGSFEKNQLVSLTVTPSRPDTTYTVLGPIPESAGPDGKLRASIKVPADAVNYSVQANWEDKEAARVITLTVK